MATQRPLVLINGQIQQLSSIDTIFGGDRTFVFVQSSPLSTWTIVHNLNKFPSVSIVDSANTEVTGTITHTNSNELIASFSASFAGKAYLN